MAIAVIPEGPGSRGERIALALLAMATIVVVALLVVFLIVEYVV